MFVVPVLTLAVSLSVALLARWGPDWPAQQFRAWTAAQHGLTVWTNSWYSGDSLLGYSVLYPVLGGVLGVVATGVLAAVAVAAGAAGFAPAASPVRAVGYHLSVVLVLAADLVIGQVPYLLGVAFGVWTLRAVRAGGRWWIAALILAVGASLASPLAGLFLLIAAPAVACAVGLRRALPLLGGAFGTVMAAVVDGSGGTFPFPHRSRWWVATFVVLALVLTTRRQRPVRVLALTYALAVVLDLLVANPVGGNIVRLGQLAALPLTWLALPELRTRPAVLGRVAAAVIGALLVGLAGLWPVYPSVTAAAKGATQPSRHAQFYAGLRRFLATQDPARGRLEAVFTRQHWESYFVARTFPIARGWEQQTDEVDNQVLYRPLTAQTYRRWLDDNAVDLVALPREPLDVFAGVYEGALLAHPPGYLRPVWQDTHWQVWRVRHARPLAGSGARLSDLGTASFVLTFARPGTSVVRIHASPLWGVTQGAACVAATPNGWLAVRARAAGRVTLRARVDLHALLRSGGGRC